MLLALALVFVQGTTWTVDDDGPADFTDLVTAVLVASDGDRILVEAGTYAGFETSKNLTIVGSGSGPKPIIGGIAITQAAGFTLAGLDIRWLRLTSVSGAAVVDDCVVRQIVPGFVPRAAVYMSDCALVSMSRILIDLNGVCMTYYQGTGAAIASIQSKLSLSDSQLRGPRGCNSAGYDYGDGGHAVVVGGGLATIAACELLGNAPGMTCGIIGCTGCCIGIPGRAVVVTGGAAVRLRGAGHLVKGASTQFASVMGPASMLVYSGVQHVGTVELASGGQHQSVAAEPFLDTTGGDAPGAAKEVRVRGPEGTAWLVVASALAATTSAPGVLGTPAWVDPAASLATIVGQIPPGAPSTLALALPPTPSLAGLTVHFQGFFPGVADPLPPGGMVVSNAIPIVLRF